MSPRAVLSAGLALLFATVLTAAEVQRAGGRGGRGAGAPLPDGPARATVEAVCSSCHQTNLITGSAGFDRQGWADLIKTMVNFPPEQLEAVTSYLATNFPPRPERRPTLVPGDTKVSFKEWIVPTLGQRPRDPLQLADGTIWWAGMYASLIGRLNPATGEMREYKLAPDAR